MKENSNGTDTNVGSIEDSVEEAIERLEYIDRAYNCNNYYSTWDLKCIEILLSDYKRVLKENEQLNKKVDLMENYMVENGWEICFDNIYAELNNCNGMERDWCRGDKLEKQDIHKYFSKKLLESEE